MSWQSWHDGDGRKIPLCCEEKPHMCDLSTHAIQLLIQERDPEIKEKAISHVENKLPTI
jgi:hypothetical protein